MVAMELLLTEGASLDIQNMYLATPLHLAIYHHHYECCTLLIDLGADINIKDIEGKTALHRAVESNYLDGLELLLDGGAKITRDKNGKT